MARVLVTGANGFIGSHLCEFLLRRGDEVVGLVRQTSDLRSLLPFFETHGDRFKLVLGDLERPPSLAAAVKDIEYVYHLAASVMGTSEQEFRSSIYTGTKNLLAALAQRPEYPLRRFLYVSSQSAAGPAPTARPQTEDDPARPISWYGRAKRDAEELVRQAGAANLPVTIVRPVAVYGERERDISGGTFPAVQLGILPRIGLGEKTLTTVYVGDLVRGLVAAAESAKTMGKTYFLGDPEPVTASHLVRTLAEVMRKRLRIPILVPHFALSLGGVFAEWAHFFTRGRPALTRDKARELRQRHWAASSAAARRDFGWVAQMSLAQGLQRSVRDWRQRRAAAGNILALPERDRLVPTFALSLVAGILTESISHLANWYHFDPPWLIFPVIGFYYLVFGSIAFLAAAWPRVGQFLAGALVFFVAEIANHYWLHFWHFEPEPFGKWNPWLRAAVLAVPIGLIPVVVNLIVGVVHRLRLRIG